MTMKKSDWISVKERLPAENEIVLITDGNNRFIGILSDGAWSIDDGCYRNHTHSSLSGLPISVKDGDDFEEHERVLITHWQPYPDLPG